MAVEAIYRLPMVSSLMDSFKSFLKVYLVAYAVYCIVEIWPY
jgi:hypothetical protein